MRHRTLLPAAAIAVVALVASVVASAATERTYTQDFAPNARGKPDMTPGAGVGSHLVWTASDSANSANNNLPKQDEYVEVIFPKGTVIDQRVIASCTATNADLLKKGPAACPKKSKVGSGSITLSSNTGQIEQTLSVFNCNKGCRRGTGIPPYEGELIIVSQTQTDSPGQYSVARAWVEERGGAPGIHIPIDITCVIGTPPDCGGQGDERPTRVELQLERLKAQARRPGAPRKVSASRRGRGVATGGYGGAFLIASPPTCPPKRQWEFILIVHGRDGTDSKLTSNSPCRRK